MNPALRAKAMLADPSAEWARIERESGDTEEAGIACLVKVPPQHRSEDHAAVDAKVLVALQRAQ